VDISSENKTHLTDVRDQSEYFGRMIQSRTSMMGACMAYTKERDDDREWELQHLRNVSPAMGSFDEATSGGTKWSTGK